MKMNNLRVQLSVIATLASLAAIALPWVGKGRTRAQSAALEMITTQTGGGRLVLVREESLNLMINTAGIELARIR
ncbi:MAG: hypothetical protein JWN25_3491 [Verrucomicrobiales bacterium]|jgi:hypothetical protein|nr:hypothetical protein [Verrucomicrobiales bacterium]